MKRAELRAAAVAKLQPLGVTIEFGAQEPDGALIVRASRSEVRHGCLLYPDYTPQHVDTVLTRLASAFPLTG
jgi:hypothetical protein